MKKAIYTFILLSTHIIVFGQRTSGVMICIKDKKSNQPIINTDAEIAFNDSIKYNLRFDNSGCIEKIEKQPGKHKISVKIDGYLQASMLGIVIGEGKIAYLNYGLTAIKDLTKKEKKQFGIK